MQFFFFFFIFFFFLFKKKKTLWLGSTLTVNPHPNNFTDRAWASANNCSSLGKSFLSWWCALWPSHREQTGSVSTHTHPILTDRRFEDGSPWADEQEGDQPQFVGILTYFTANIACVAHFPTFMPIFMCFCHTVGSQYHKIEGKEDKKIKVNKNISL